MKRASAYLLQSLVPLGAVAITVVLCLFTVRGQEADQAAMVAMGQSSNRVVGLGSYLGTTFVPAASVLIVAASVLFALVRRRIGQAAAAALLFAGSAVTSQLLKNEVLARPALLSDAGWYGNSLPSGHVSLAVAAACAVVFVLPRGPKLVAAPVVAAGALLAGVGIIAAGWHRPSDVIAATLLVGCWCSISAGVVGLASQLAPNRRVIVATGPAGAAPLAAAVLLVGSAVSAVALALGYAASTWSTVSSVALMAVTVVLTSLAAAAISSDGRVFRV